jgi:peptidoglycan/xylan/chitin deacetylase (PgdA/CDA1 family)
VRSGYRRTTLLALLLAAACSPSRSPAAAPSATPHGTARAPSPAVTAAPPAGHADELGQVPVLMYHRLLSHPKGAYDQTPAQFRAELQDLYAAGYRTVTAADLVAGRIDVPAGASPMVLTFDDSTVSQYRELPDGSVDPASAIGILLAVARAAGEAHPVATLYVNAHPFGGHDGYLRHLHALGMELGDHTSTHANLRRLDDAGVQREITAGLAVLTHQGLTASTFALPFGAHPRHAGLAQRGAGYAFRGVLLVGSNPARSPYSKGFDPLAVPRIRSGLKTGDQASTSTYWLPRLRATRYVSDGDPATISFPRSKAALLAPRYASRARPY